MPTDAPTAYFTARGLSTAPPHVRSPLTVPRLQRALAVAALPALLLGLHNAGLQANLGLAAGAAASGWRAQALEALGIGHATSGIVSPFLHGALYFAPLFVVALLAGGSVEVVFARLRGRPFDPVALPMTALLFTLCLPASLPAWQAALGAALGVAIGQEIFGGFGRGFVHPVVAGLSFLYFAYPGSLSGDAVWGPVGGWSGATALGALADGTLEPTGPSWWTAFVGRGPGTLGGSSPLAAGIGAVVLLYAGASSWRIVLGAIGGLAAAVLLLEASGAGGPAAALPWHWHLVVGGFAFGLVFLVSDPVTAAVTNPGRWIYGALFGAVVGLVRIANPAHREGVFLAVLLANVAAPLIDQIVVRLGSWRRRPDAG